MYMDRVTKGEEDGNRVIGLGSVLGSDMYLDRGKQIRNIISQKLQADYRNVPDIQDYAKMKNKKLPLGEALVRTIHQDAITYFFFILIPVSQIISKKKKIDVIQDNDDDGDGDRNSDRTEVKPGKPYSHSFDPVRGRLHISQATLGPGSSQKKTFLQCNVGDKSPVLLCVLLPDKTESCKLDLEFAEANQVVFSVVGPRAVFLTGYYLDNGRRLNQEDESYPSDSLRESYGVDIANTESEESNHCTDEDEYEDSFINDGDPETVSRSPISSSGDDDEAVEIQKPHDRKGRFKRLRKRYISVESDDDTKSTQQNIANASRGIPESGDEDNFTISHLIKKMVQIAAAEESPSGMRNKLVKDDTEDTDSLVTESKGKVDALVIDDDPKSGPALESIIKPNRKRKRRSKAQQAEEQGFMLMRRKLDEKQTENSGEIGLPYYSELPDMKEGSGDGPRAKRRRKEWAAELQEGNNLSDVLKEDQAKKDEVKVENMGKDHKPVPDKIILTDSDKLANEHLSEKEKARKTKKNKKFKSKLQENEEHVSSKEGCNRSKQEHEVKHVDARSSTLSSGLIIEVLELGNCDGKFASPGKKVKLHYICKLKENGRVIDSNIGKAPYKFQLGDEKVPEGWNVGVDGLGLPQSSIVSSNVRKYPVLERCGHVVVKVDAKLPR
ncbi:hypothetical protein RJ639_035728 [Escallonia herrerae]|uniref:peptidylprolyl isomerase n=1 Tax=Escallonia herrerae TaxID=1293975 RepID=A0AA88WX67_9ASTE|nr:hypothetical protein RJ639_035728 [Escallonia herrerae]